MSTYETLKGLKVKFLGADTSGDRVQEGEIFYNSVDYGLKSHIATGAWSAGANVIVSRYNSGGAGTQTASFLAGGANSPDDAITDETYEYNGSGWSTGGTMAGTDRLTTGSGTLTAGLIAGGNPGSSPYNAADSEEYNGTAWTNAGNMNVARDLNRGSGTQTDAVSFSGRDHPNNANVATTEAYDGTSWSTLKNTLTTARRGYHTGNSGATSSATFVCAGGPPASNATEEWTGAGAPQIRTISRD